MQPIGSNTCGFFAVAWMESEIAAMRNEGPASRGWVPEMVSQWKIRLSMLLKMLKIELDKLTSQKDLAEKKAQLAQDKAALAAGKKAKFMSESKEVIDAETSLAAELLSEGHALTVADLPEEQRLHIEHITNLNKRVCSTCRFLSGCWLCDGAKTAQ